MRLHRLEVTAFGPFADHQEVDFDRLSAAGLFLLHGPTGAGKTSVLDAVCFALYGRVPGVRGGAGRLRSDHAAAHVGPEVVCDFSVSGRRFEVTRSPEWQRPKKRGTGTVREQAHVVVRERIGADWSALTNRVDEAAELLQDLIGLGPEQFTKLILLPQGDFAAFLRATAEERRPLLQKLFGTDRFAEVERWLADRRREFEHHMHAANAATARLFARAEEARLTSGAHADPGQGSDSAMVEVDAATALVTEWAEYARAQLTLAHVQVRAAERDFEQARRATETAIEAVQSQARQAAWTDELDALRTAEPEQQRRRTAIVAAAHALVLAPLLTELDDAQHRRQSAQFQWSDAQTEARSADQDPAEATPGRLTRLREELGSLAELLRAELDLRRLDAQHQAGEQQIEAAQRECAEADRLLLELTARRTELAADRADAELIAVTLPDRELGSARATAVAKAVLDQQQLTLEQAALKDELRTAIDVHQASVEASQQLRARRLEGMAAELAARLGDETPCPVCGSCEHPAPARHAAPAVTERAQQRAEATEKTAASKRELVQAQVNEAAERSAALLAISGGADAEAAAAGLIQAERRVVEARTTSSRVRQLITQLDAIEGRVEQAQSRQTAAGALAASGREALAEIVGRRTDLRERLDRARGEDVDVQARQHRLAAAAEAVAHCLSARADLEQATDRLDRARAAADRAAEAAGFTDRKAAGAAVLPEAERERLVSQVAEHDAQVARLQALLDEARPAQPPVAVPRADDDGADDLQLDLFGLLEAEPVQAEPVQPDPPDLDQLAEAQAQVRQAHEVARERHTLAGRAVRALTGLAAELAEHADATAPLRRRFAALDSVSRCAEGTGGDNTLRMRLSSYVLAARLEQVADAASIRLAAMSGGRYLLVHTDGPSRGGARSGLGLAVIDGWTGVQRDPASLSGGETFCTSLALALGLADVVQAEAGGSVIETLLVDEGFGSLDEETLDEVMDVLDGLRSAGRSVGLVSHVADLRDRIPAQLRVLKTRTGSQLIA